MHVTVVLFVLRGLVQCFHSFPLNLQGGREGRRHSPLTSLHHEMPSQLLWIQLHKSTLQGIMKHNKTLVCQEKCKTCAADSSAAHSIFHDKVMRKEIKKQKEKKETTRLKEKPNVKPHPHNRDTRDTNRPQG